MMAARVVSIGSFSFPDSALILLMQEENKEKGYGNP